MKSSKRVVKAGLAGALVLALGITTLFTNAGSSYAAGEAKLNKTSCNILTQRTFDFDVTGASKDAEITWESSDEKVASVDADGVVTGIKKGDVTITCKITADGKTQKLKAKVQVCKPAVKVDITSKITELEYKKTYNLTIDAIELHVYKYGMGILFLRTLNMDKDTTLADIKRINDKGRSISLPFLPDDGDGYILCAESLKISFGESEYVADFRGDIRKFYGF